MDTTAEALRGVVRDGAASPPWEDLKLQIYLKRSFIEKNAALLVAESDPGQRDLMVRLILNLLFTRTAGMMETQTQTDGNPIEQYGIARRTLYSIPPSLDADATRFDL